jgi:glycosyltransferase involved in cell wall biosynthesis
MERIRVMHMVDTLNAGGRERVAVNLVNSLPRDRYVPYLCTTRYDGALAGLVAEDVRRLNLGRAFRYDARAIFRLVRFIQDERIQIIHAHDAAIFLAAIARSFRPHPAVVWHDHFGLQDVETRPAWLYRAAVSRAQAVVAVNEALAEWSRAELRLRPEKVRYIPNFACRPERNGAPPALPGKPGSRVVCVANLRAQKDQLTLVRAMSQVASKSPDAHLLLVGAPTEADYAGQVREEIARQGLGSNVSLLGERDDVFAILEACDVGVLSSASEGLPLALLEYGMAGLPAVATDVGQCSEVLDHGRAGILVPPGAPQRLADAVVSLLQSPELRVALGAELRKRVDDHYTIGSVVQRVTFIYQTVLQGELGR